MLYYGNNSSLQTQKGGDFMKRNNFKETEERCKNYITSLLHNHRSNGHGDDHSLRVLSNAMKIAKGYSCNMEVVTLAALLHDVDDHKLFNTVNNANARKFLVAEDIVSETIEEICEVINVVSFTHGQSPRTIEGKIVQDADRLDAIGAIGIARAFAYGGSVGNDLSNTIQHFRDKLLKLKGMMNTPEATEEAELRHEEIVSFLSQLIVEGGGI